MFDVEFLMLDGAIFLNKLNDWYNIQLNINLSSVCLVNPWEFNIEIMLLSGVKFFKLIPFYDYLKGQIIRQ